MTTVTLLGLRPEPLASYLSALGVLRLVSRQADPAARGSWGPHGFVLTSTLDEEALERFFLEDYAPSPILSPWNGGSGFYEGDANDWLRRVKGSEDARLSGVRGCVEIIEGWPELPRQRMSIAEIVSEARRVLLPPPLKEGARRTRTKTIDDAESAAEDAGLLASSRPLVVEIEEHRGAKGNTKKAIAEVKKLRSALNDSARKRSKVRIMARFRAELPEDATAWLDAAVAITEEDAFTALPLLGSGGNEGRLDFSNRFLDLASQIVDGALLRGRTRNDPRPALRSALWGELCAGLPKEPTGQFQPGRAGGFNQGPGLEHKDTPSNPWLIVLSLEGALLWSGAVSRRAGPPGAPRLSVSPFTVRAAAVGYGSAADSDADNARGELWTPLWSRPVTLRELRAFLAEGRAETAGRPARSGLDFARAAASLGVDRGVDRFVRYGLFKRRGDSYVALPTGTFDVRLRRSADLVRDLDAPLGDLDRMLRGFPHHTPPARLGSARRRLDEALFRFVDRGEPDDGLAVLRRVGQLECLLGARDPRRDPKLHRPLAGLSAAWLRAAGPEHLELRLAAALASLKASGGVGPLRANLSPIAPETPWLFLGSSGARGGSQRSWTGPTLPHRMAHTLTRRLVDGEHLGTGALPLLGRVSASAEDVHAFLFGETDDALLEDLVHALTWLNWRDDDLGAVTAGWAHSPQDPLVLPAYAMLKLLLLPHGVPGPGGPVAVHPEPALVPLLLAGRQEAATELAARRLLASGLPPRLTRARDPVPAVRLAAALLFPIHETEKLRRVALKRSPGT